MHTFEGKTCRIHFNSDGSGNALIDTGAGPEIEVLCSDLMHFVAEQVRARRIYQLEQASARDLVGL
jgi:hypothetical protein